MSLFDLLGAESPYSSPDPYASGAQAVEDAQTGGGLTGMFSGRKSKTAAIEALDLSTAPDKIRGDLIARRKEAVAEAARMPTGTGVVERVMEQLRRGGGLDGTDEFKATEAKFASILAKDQSPEALQAYQSFRQIEDAYRKAQAEDPITAKNTFGNAILQGVTSLPAMGKAILFDVAPWAIATAGTAALTALGAITPLPGDGTLAALAFTGSMAKLGNALVGVRRAYAGSKTATTLAKTARSAWGTAATAVPFFDQFKADSFRKAVDSGVRPEIANVSANAAGLAGGLLEGLISPARMLGIGGKAGLHTLISAQLWKSGAKSITTAITKFTADRVLSAFGEDLEEAAQGGSTALSSYLAAKYQQDPEVVQSVLNDLSADIKSPTVLKLAGGPELASAWDVFYKTALQSGIEAAPAVAGLAIMGLPIGAIQATRQYNGLRGLESRATSLLGAEAVQSPLMRGGSEREYAANLITGIRRGEEAKSAKDAEDLVTRQREAAEEDARNEAIADEDERILVKLAPQTILAKNGMLEQVGPADELADPESKKQSAKDLNDQYEQTKAILERMYAETATPGTPDADEYGRRMFRMQEKTILERETARVKADEDAQTQFERKQKVESQAGAIGLDLSTVPVPDDRADDPIGVYEEAIKERQKVDAQRAAATEASTTATERSAKLNAIKESLAVASSPIGKGQAKKVVKAQLAPEAQSAIDALYPELAGDAVLDAQKLSARVNADLVRTAKKTVAATTVVGDALDKELSGVDLQMEQVDALPANTNERVKEAAAIKRKELEARKVDLKRQIAIRDAQTEADAAVPPATPDAPAIQPVQPEAPVIDKAAADAAIAAGTKAQEDARKAADETASIPVVVTRTMKLQLRKLGYTPAQYKEMNAQEAAKILDEKLGATWREQEVAIGETASPEAIRSDINRAARKLGVTVRPVADTGTIIDENNLRVNLVRGGLEAKSRVSIAEDGRVEVEINLDNSTTQTVGHETWRHIGLAGQTEANIRVLLNHFGLTVPDLKTKEGRLQAEEALSTTLDRVDEGQIKVPRVKAILSAIKQFIASIARTLGYDWNPQDAFATLRNIESGRAARAVTSGEATVVAPAVRNQLAKDVKVVVDSNGQTYVVATGANGKPKYTTRDGKLFYSLSPFTGGFEGEKVEWVVKNGEPVMLTVPDEEYEAMRSYENWKAQQPKKRAATATTARSDDQVASTQDVRSREAYVARHTENIPLKAIYKSKRLLSRMSVGLSESLSEATKRVEEMLYGQSGVVMRRQARGGRGAFAVVGGKRLPVMDVLQSADAKTLAASELSRGVEQEDVIRGSRGMARNPARFVEGVYSMNRMDFALSLYNRILSIQNAIKSSALSGGAGDPSRLVTIDGNSWDSRPTRTAGEWRKEIRMLRADYADLYESSQIDALIEMTDDSRTSMRSLRNTRMSDSTKAAVSRVEEAIKGLDDSETVSVELEPPTSYRKESQEAKSPKRRDSIIATRTVGEWRMWLDKKSTNPRMRALFRAIEELRAIRTDGGTVLSGAVGDRPQTNARQITDQDVINATGLRPIGIEPITTGKRKISGGRVTERPRTEWVVRFEDKPPIAIQTPVPPGAARQIVEEWKMAQLRTRAARTPVTAAAIDKAASDSAEREQTLRGRINALLTDKVDGKTLAEEVGERIMDRFRIKALEGVVVSELLRDKGTERNLAESAVDQRLSSVITDAASPVMMALRKRLSSLASGMKESLIAKDATGKAIISEGKATYVDVDTMIERIATAFRGPIREVVGSELGVTELVESLSEAAVGVGNVSVTELESIISRVSKSARGGRGLSGIETGNLRANVYDALDKAQGEPVTDTTQGEVTGREPSTTPEEDRVESSTEEPATTEELKATDAELERSASDTLRDVLRGDIEEETTIQAGEDPVTQQDTTEEKIAKGTFEGDNENAPLTTRESQLHESVSRLIGSLEESGVEVVQRVMGVVVRRQIGDIVRRGRNAENLSKDSSAAARLQWKMAEKTFIERGVGMRDAFLDGMADVIYKLRGTKSANGRAGEIYEQALSEVSKAIQFAMESRAAGGSRVVMQRIIDSIEKATPETRDDAIDEAVYVLTEFIERANTEEARKESTEQRLKEVMGGRKSEEFAEAQEKAYRDFVRAISGTVTIEKAAAAISKSRQIIMRAARSVTLGELAAREFASMAEQARMLGVPVRQVVLARRNNLVLAMRNNDPRSTSMRTGYQEELSRTKSTLERIDSNRAATNAAVEIISRESVAMSRERERIRRTMPSFVARRRAESPVVDSFTDNRNSTEFDALAASASSVAGREMSRRDVAELAALRDRAKAAGRSMIDQLTAEISKQDAVTAVYSTLQRPSPVGIAKTRIGGLPESQRQLSPMTERDVDALAEKLGQIPPTRLTGIPAEQEIALRLSEIRRLEALQIKQKTKEQKVATDWLIADQNKVDPGLVSSLIGWRELLKKHPGLSSAFERSAAPSSDAAIADRLRKPRFQSRSASGGGPATRENVHSFISPVFERLGGTYTRMRGGSPDIGMARLGGLQVRVQFGKAEDVATGRTGAAMVQQGVARDYTITIDPDTGRITSAPHELAHIVRDTLTETQAGILKDVFGYDIRTEEGDEAFARDMETDESRAAMAERILRSKPESRNFAIRYINRVGRWLRAFFDKPYREMTAERKTLANGLKDYSLLLQGGMRGEQMDTRMNEAGGAFEARINFSQKDGAFDYLADIGSNDANMSELREIAPSVKMFAKLPEGSGGGYARITVDSAEEARRVEEWLAESVSRERRSSGGTGATELQRLRQVRFSAPGRTRLQSAEKELTYAEALKKLTNAGRKPMAEWIKAGKPGSYNAWVKEQASIVPQNEVANVLRSEAGPIRKAGERGNAVTRVIRDLHSEYGLHGANLARIIGKETHAKYLKDAVEADILNSGAMRELITLRQSPEHIKLARGANLLRRLAAEDSDGLKFTTTRSSIATLHMTLKAARLSEGLLAARSGERAYQSYLDGIQRTEGKDVRRSVAQMQQPFMYRPEVRDNNDKVITKAAFAPDTKVTMRMDIGGVFGRKRTNYEFKGSDLLRMVETNADDSIRAYADNLQKIFDRGYDLMAESFRRNNPGKEPPKKMWYYVPQRRIDYETQSSGAQAGAAERRRRHRLGVELNPDLAETESTNARKFSKAGFVIEPIHALVADYTTDVSHYVGYTKMANEWKAALEDLGTREAITGNHGEGLYKGLYSAIASTEGPTEITTTLERLFNTVLGRAARVMLATGRVIMYQPVSYMAYAPRYGMARVMTSPRRALTAEGRRIIEMVRNSKNGAPIWERHTRSTVERLYTDETTSGNEYIADTGIRKPGAGGEVRHWLQWLADRGPVLLSRSDSLAVNSGAIAAFEFFKERNPGMSDADIANMAARDLYEQTVQTQTTRSPLFTTEARRSRSLMPKLLTFMSGGTSATYNQLWGSGLDLFRKGGSTPENVSNFSKTIITAMTQAAVIAAIRTMYSGRPKGDDDDDENATREFGYNVAESIVSLLPAGQSYSSATMAFAATVFDHPDMRRRFGFLASREVQDAPFRGLALAGKGVEQLIRADRSGDLSEKQRDILRENGIKNIKKSIWTTGDLLLGVSWSSNLEQFKSVADRYGLDMGD